MTDIEVVIKIPEETYKATCDESMLPPDVENVVNAIKNGTLLPKGHGDLKDQKDLAESLYDYKYIDQLTYIDITSRLVNAPTIIEEDREEE